MKCPNCKDTTLVLSERKGIEIDYCPDCRGIWLDRGELDKLVGKSFDEERSARRDTDYVSYHQPEPHYKHHKRKKSFLEELFD